jgi:inner membrane transporter RhtA
VFAAFGPAGAGGLRFVAGAVVLLVLARPRIRGRAGASWAAVTCFGATLAATNLCLYEAIATIPLGLAVTLEFLGPVAIALVGARRRLDMAWALSAALGVVLLGETSGAAITGVAWAVGAAVSVAGSILVAKRVGERIDGIDGLALSVSVAALLTLPVSLPAALRAPHFRDLAVVAAVGVLAIAFPYALEFNVLRRIGAKTYSILLSLDPAIAALVGLILLDQRLNLAEFCGIGLVVAASAGAVATSHAP